jgi:hypothetical protein
MEEELVNRKTINCAKRTQITNIGQYLKRVKRNGKTRRRANKEDMILFVSLGSSTVQLHDSLGSRRACACSEAGSSSQNGGNA